MPTSIDVVRRLTVQGQSVGLDRLQADLKAVSGAQGEVATSSARLVSATTSVERSTLSAQRSLDNMTRSLDPLSKALAQQERLQRAVGAAQGQGVTLSAANERAIANAAARVEELRAATEKHTASVVLNRAQMMESVHVLKSLADETIATGNPLRALALEGGRIAQIFSEGSGGVSGTLKGFGTAISGLIPPSVAAGGAILGIAVAASTAALAWEDSQRKLAASLEGTGRSAGSTLDQLNAVAEAGAKAGHISTSQGRELAGGFAQAGISASQNQALIGLTPAYARATGQDVGDAGKALADAFADPEKGADTLNKQFGFLNDRIATQIHQAEAAGNLEAARQTELAAFAASLKDVTDHTWTLSRLFDQAKINVSSFVDDFGKQAAIALGGQTHGQELQSLKDRLPYTSNALPGYFNTDFVTKEINRLQQLVDQQAKTDTTTAARRKAEADANTLSLQARDVIRGALPGIERDETFASQSDILRRVLANPGGLANQGATSQALGNMTVQHAFSDPLTVVQKDAELARASVDAFSLAERAAVDARRAELQVLRDSGDTAKATAAAHEALNLAMAKARSDAEDRLETSKQDLAMVGMTPFQRGLREIDNQFKGYGGVFSKDAARPNDLATAVQPIQADLRTAGDILAGTLRDIANQARGAFATADGHPIGSPYGSLGNVRLTGQGALAQAPASIFPMISGAADQTGIDARIIAAIGKVENGFKLTGGTSLLGSDGRPSSAFGYGQLTDAAARDVAAVVPGFDKRDPSTAVFGSAEYLSILQRRNGGNLTKALNAYGGDPAYAGKIYAAAGASFTPSAATNTDAVATLSADQGTYANRRQTYIGDQFSAPLQQANQALDEQIKLLDVQQSTMGQSASKIEAAAKAQQLFNQYTAMDPNHEAGTAMWTKISDGVDAYREKLAGVLEKQAQLAAQNQKLIGTMDGIRGASRDALGTFLTDVRNGQSAGKALGDVMNGFENKLLSFAEDQAIKGLFGTTGTANGGIFGNLLGAGSTGLVGMLTSILHEGGTVGQDGRMAVYPAAMFSGAPRYHSGMGLAPDEHPAILQRGEAVVSRADLAAARAQKSQAQIASAAPAAAAMPAMELHFHQESGTQVRDVQASRGPNNTHVLKAFVVNTMMEDLNGGGKYSRGLKNFGGMGRTGG